MMHEGDEPAVQQGLLRGTQVSAPVVRAIPRETKPLIQNVLEHLPDWLLAIAGVVYATGFLVVSAFFDRFGLHAAGIEFLKVKYVHVGMMCLLFPMAVVAPICALAALVRRQRQAVPAEPIRFYSPSIIYILNLLTVFYVMVCFEPPGFLAKKESLILAIFFVTICGGIGIQSFSDHLTKWMALAGLHWESDLYEHATKRRVGNWGRWLLALAILPILDWYSLRDLMPDLWKILVRGGINFVLLIGLISLVVWRVSSRSAQLADVRSQALLRIVGLCLVIALSYMAVRAFAVHIFPYIPVDKGGGDYVFRRASLTPKPG